MPMPTAQHPSGSAVALLVDGTAIEIRPPKPVEHDAVYAFFCSMSPDSAHRRFLGSARLPGRTVADEICSQDTGQMRHRALLALLDDQIVGVVDWAPTNQVGDAEIAFAISDGLQRRGAATLLAEHAIAAATREGFQRLVADTELDNYAMQDVFNNLGLTTQRSASDGLAHISIPLRITDAERSSYLMAVEARERAADEASLRHVFHPASVTVVGAGRAPGGVGRAILDNLRSGGFTGPLSAVNPHANEVAGVPCFPSVAELPEAPELAVIAVPPAAALLAAEQCGRQGVCALVVPSSGFDATTGRELLETCRRYGMRLVGPNCLGVACTSDDVRLDATFGAHHPGPGTAGVAVQSGGVGIAMLEHLARMGIGISTFASVGDKYDVSTNDLLRYWDEDPNTRLGLIYVESFGNPRKFSRSARHLSQRMPLLTVAAGRSAEGRRAAASHTAAATASPTSAQALFTQAGVITTRSLGELTALAALLDSQPLPGGNAVAVVSNTAGAGILATDACVESDLSVPVLDQAAQQRLKGILPDGATVTNPVDTGPDVSVEILRDLITALAAEDFVDAVLVALAPTALGDLKPALTGITSVSAAPPEHGDTPLLAVLLDQPEAVMLLETESGQRVPAYTDPTSAAGALGRARRYAAWRERDPGTIPDFPDIAPSQARDLAEAHLTAYPTGGWMRPQQAAELLRCYGIETTPTIVVHDDDEAVRAARELGMPAALKALRSDATHKSDEGGVVLNLADPVAVRIGYQELADRFGTRLDGVLVQPMAKPGLELRVGVTHDEVFGPLVVFGTGGITSDVLGDSATRLTPLTDKDAADLVNSTREAGLLRGHDGGAACDLAALRELLTRVGKLADDLPSLAELDLNPVIVGSGDMSVVDARVRLLRPRNEVDPYLRELPKSPEA